MACSLLKIKFVAFMVPLQERSKKSHYIIDYKTHLRYIFTILDYLKLNEIDIHITEMHYKALIIEYGTD